LPADRYSNIGGNGDAGRIKSKYLKGRTSIESRIKFVLSREPIAVPCGGGGMVLHLPQLGLVMAYLGLEHGLAGPSQTPRHVQLKTKPQRQCKVLQTSTQLTLGRRTNIHVLLAFPLEAPHPSRPVACLPSPAPHPIRPALPTRLRSLQYTPDYPLGS
jgi:hypothetical protein